MTSTKLAGTTNAVAHCLDEIREYFVPEVKITLLVRLPGNDEADFSLSDDTDEGVQSITKRRFLREERRGK